MINEVTPPENISNIDFEKQKIQNDIDDFKKSGKIPEALTTRKFLIQYNNIYECVLDWSKTLGMENDPIWSELADSYIDCSRSIEIAAAYNLLKQLEQETRDFFKLMSCKTYKFLTTVIKGDAQYNSHIFSLARELEFITPKIKYGITLNKMEKFKVDLYINHQIEILDNIKLDLNKINDIIIRYRPHNYLTWSESMYMCLQFRSNLDNVLKSYVNTAEAINSNIPFSQR